MRSARCIPHPRGNCAHCRCWRPAKRRPLPPPPPPPRRRSRHGANPHHKPLDFDLLPPLPPCLLSTRSRKRPPFLPLVNQYRRQSSSYCFFCGRYHSIRGRRGHKKVILNSECLPPICIFMSTTRTNPVSLCFFIFFPIYYFSLPWLVFGSRLFFLFVLLPHRVFPSWDFDARSLCFGVFLILARWFAECLFICWLSSMRRASENGFDRRWWSVEYTGGLRLRDGPSELAVEAEAIGQESWWDWELRVSLFRDALWWSGLFIPFRVDE